MGGPDLWEALPFAAMIAVECLDVGLTTLSKAAMSKGMSHFIFVFYSNCLASLILIPVSFFFHRSKRLPITFPLLCRFFFLGLTGTTILQNCVFTGISYSSPTLGSAMGNLVPAFTFAIAVIFRLEKLDIRSSSCQAKLMGTFISISGAFVVSLYKGPPMSISSLPFASHHHHHLSQDSPDNSLQVQNWVLGGLFLATASLSISIWNNLQAATVKIFPAEISLVAYNCFFGTIQCAIVSMIAERNPSAWILTHNIEYISIIYSAVFGSVLSFSAQTWCMHKKGPIFVAMFKPLGIAIAAIMSAVFLGDTLYLGSLIGAVIIVLGFYVVMWGQATEKKENKKDIDDVEPSSKQKVPLLQDI